MDRGVRTLAAVDHVVLDTKLLSCGKGGKSHVVIEADHGDVLTRVSGKGVQDQWERTIGGSTPVDTSNDRTGLLRGPFLKVPICQIRADVLDPTNRAI